VLSLEILQILVESKSDINLVDTSFGDSALYFACDNMNSNLSLEIVKFLIESKSELNMKDVSGRTALHIASDNINISLDIIQYLVESKSDLNIKDQNHKVPLYYASKNEKINQQILEKFGKKISVEKAVNSNDNNCFIF
jgi:ankyrin repeat protein